MTYLYKSAALSVGIPFFSKKKKPNNNYKLYRQFMSNILKNTIMTLVFFLNIARIHSVFAIV